jgi:hypothetical protein
MTEMGGAPAWVCVTWWEDGLYVDGADDLMSVYRRLAERLLGGQDAYAIGKPNQGWADALREVETGVDAGTLSLEDAYDLLAEYVEAVDHSGEAEAVELLSV